MRARESRLVSTAETAAWVPPLPDAPGFDHLVVETPGLRTHVATIGAGEPVVMLHGFPQHWWQWHRVAPRIAEQGYRVICPDLRGSGWTEADEPGIERETRLHDLLAVFEALGVERAHVVSHDMGAVTAAQLAYAHPRRVGRAVQFSMPPVFMSFSPRLVPAFRHLPSLVWHRPGSSLRRVFTGPYNAEVLPDATIAAHLAPMRRPEVDQAVRRLYRGMVLPESMRLSRGVYRRMRLTVPTLVAFGRLDTRFEESLIRRVCSHPERFADRMELAFVDGAGKLVPDDAPDTVAELALDWIRRAD
ncbi:alpha/beta fold hydrolase [Agromyces mariniharenae]|uniref:Alpha/beta hydrolase n=1 Tax=Agromyces mariniharenae TaxID=2604423 RepID=A0A5S4V9G9_9MICO|nr:alpha/beta hydrolase [Agromyces mariniharenae]TYL53230.1 alpha/beta hydrolase [Agromyces mariniharenae]